MAAQLSSLVPQEAAYAHALHTLELASRQLASPSADERAQATSTLLAFRDAPDMVDHACYALAYSEDTALHFHVLGALLARLPTLPAERPGKHVASLLDMREWLLHAALTRERGGVRGARALPPFVRTRMCRAVVLLTKRILAGVACRDASPLLVLSEHARQLLGAAAQDAACGAIGLVLTEALTEELDADVPRRSEQHAAAPGAEDLPGRVPVGLNAGQHLWCKLVFQTACLPTLLPDVFRALPAATNYLRASAEPARALELLELAARALEAVLAWRFVLLDADGWESLPPEQLVYLQGEPDKWVAAAATPDSALDKERVPPALEEALLSPDLPEALLDAHRAAAGQGGALRSEALGARLRTCLGLLAAYEPAHAAGIEASHGVALWRWQRGALFRVLGALATETPLPTSGTSAEAVDDAQVEMVRFLAQLFRGLLAGAQGGAYFAAEYDAAPLAAPLEPLTQAALHTALATLPFSADTPPELLAAADVALDEVLGAWDALVRLATGGGDARLARAAGEVHAYVRERVVLPYMAARLGAAEPAAIELGEEAPPDVETYAEQLAHVATLARACCLPEAVHTAASALDGAARALRGAGAVADATWEHLHWACLLLGHLVADPAAGETPTVPRAVAQAPPETQHAVLGVLELASIALLGELGPRGPSSSEPCSPQVMASLLWLTARWMPGYLLRSDDDVPLYPLEEQLAGDTGIQILGQLVQRLAAVPAAWATDAEVLCALAHVLHSASLARGVMCELLALPETHALAEQLTAHLEQMPGDAQAALVAALLRCVYAARDGRAPAAPLRAAYYAQVLGAVQQRIGAAATLARSGAGAARAAPGAIAALGVLRALAESADPLVSTEVHDYLLAELSTVLELAQALAAEPSVLHAAWSSVLATLRALREFGPSEDAPQLQHAARGVHALLEAVPAHAAACDGGSADDAEPLAELLALVFGVLQELAGVAHEAADDAVPTSGAPGDAAQVCVHGFVLVVRALRLELLRMPRLAAALAPCVAQVLSTCRGVLLALGGDASAELPPAPVLAASPDAQVNPIAPERAALAPLTLVLRAVTYVLSTLDGAALSQVFALTDALGALGAQLPAVDGRAAPLAGAVDAAVADVLYVLLLGDADRALLDPLVYTLRSLVLHRCAASALGGPATLRDALERFCAHVPLEQADDARTTLRNAVLHVLDAVLASQVPARVPSSPLEAQLMRREQHETGARFSAELRPFVFQMRSVLRVA